MKNIVEYYIKAKDITQNAISAASSRLAKFAKSVGTNLMNIKAGFDMAKGAVSVFASVVKNVIGESFKFESALVGFKTLLGSIDEAKKHVEDLKTFAAATPLTFGDLSKASRLLLSFGSSIEEVMPSLKTLGDIALGDAQRFQGLALVFAQVKSQGRLLGQDLLQMVNQGFNPLTVISKETGVSMAELRDRMSQGSISFEMVAEAMRVATSEGGRFHNAMKDASKTGEGLISTLQDNWTQAVIEFGNAFAEASKNGISTLSDDLKKLREDGTIKEWAEESLQTLEHLKNGLLGIREAYKWLGISDLWNAVQGSFRGVGDSIGAMVGTAQGGGGIGDVLGAGFRGLGEGFIEEMDDDAHYWNLAGGRFKDGKPILDEETIRKREEEAAARKEKEEAEKKDRERREHENEMRSLREMYEEMLAESEAKREQEKEQREKERAERQAQQEKERAEREAEREKRRIERQEQERLEALRREEEEAERIEQKLHAQKVKDISEEMGLSMQAESTAEARLQNAQAKVQQAWGWYRDKNSMQAAIDEHKAQAEAEVQWAKDFDRLKSRRRDWRDIEFGELSAADEATRQVALAKEAEQKAKQDLAEIVENTAVLNQIYETLVGGGE